MDFVELGEFSQCRTMTVVDAGGWRKSRLMSAVSVGGCMSRAACTESCEIRQLAGRGAILSALIHALRRAAIGRVASR